MKVKAPLDSCKETVPLIEAGADELYCGVYTKRWQKRGLFSNARHMFYGNLSSFQELEHTVKIASRKSVPVYFCLNDYYPHEAVDLVKNDIRRAVSCGVKGFILADFTLCPYIRSHDKKTKIILSSLTPCFNRKSISFFKKQGYDRVILPLSQFRLDELGTLLAYADDINIEIEAFVNNITCRHVNGFCVFHNVGIESFYSRNKNAKIQLLLWIARSLTRIIPSKLKKKIGKNLYVSPLAPSRGCRKPYSMVVSRRGKEISKHANISLEKDFAKQYCMLCSIYFLMQNGLTAGKITGRGFSLQRKLSDVKCISQLRNNIDNGVVREFNLPWHCSGLLQRYYNKKCSDKKCFFRP